MFKDDETSVDHGGVAHDLVPVGDDLGRGDGSAVDVEVAGVEGSGWADARPHDWRETHGSRNGADTVTEEQRNQSK